MPEINQNGNTVVNVKKSRNGSWIDKEFSASVFLFFIKGRISVDYRGVHITEQNTMLGIIPAGQNKQTIPLNNISGASISTAYKASRFFWGAILAILGIFTLPSSPLLGIILAVIGVVMFANGILTKLFIEKSGTAYALSVPFFNKADIIAVQQVIEQALEANADKTDNSLYMKRLNEEDMSDVQ
ncbi:MAG: hypothetical protein LKJ29_00525 [Lactobacillus sp.]|jgi:hypothetical protein|uniref:DUF2892 domain-containing protein n=1 Tax=Lacticaseibacillus suilingensis TaxID=2799577 RepID=A0ABW4BEA0_9LACO|nr:hypothetical protein [Lacticaseibacillus suilingensis]MCI1893329.1 hypothetical protein [Lactobacillus sp.]MCI1940514.1 hypothetical protein [Lactobacillus sp.]MCI1971081.1 hypothetical protein [Lactobacillus sp.]MCI2017869.1 hypothetical protein [Lactobacillus sp.]